MLIWTCISIAMICTSSNLKINRKIELLCATHLTYNHNTYAYSILKVDHFFQILKLQPTLPKNAQVMQCLTAVFRQVVYTTNSKHSVPHVGDGRPPIKKKHRKQWKNQLLASFWVGELLGFQRMHDMISTEALKEKNKKKTIWHAHKTKLKSLSTISVTLEPSLLRYSVAVNITGPAMGIGSQAKA